MNNKHVNKDLTLDNGATLKWLEKNYDYYLNKTTLVYGRTQSGKSTIINEIMHMCRNFIPCAFVICQSSVTTESSDYFGKVPNHCIKSNVTIEWLDQFLTTQKGRSAVYRIANNMDNLRSVVNRVRQQDTTNTEATVINEAAKHIKQIEISNSLDYAQKKEQIETVKKIEAKHLVQIYKSAIRKNKVVLENMSNLNEQETCVIKYLDFNPNIMIIWDDCAASFKKWVKASPDIAEMFYNGRHYFITQIISAQDDTKIDADLRKNALVSIFTTSQIAVSNFTRTANGYSRDEKKRAELCIKKIFGSETNLNVKNYKKLIYLQSTTVLDPFCYTIADVYPNVKMCCDALWKIDEKMNELSGNKIDNSFFTKYGNI